MNSEIAAQLIELNHAFYKRFGESFSATRQRIQPGVRRVIDMLDGDEIILDLGCGNGWFARELADRNHRGSYLGVDFSLPLLRDAVSCTEGFTATFKEIDLTKLSVTSEQLLITDNYSLITSFAVLHHIPSYEIRLDILQTVHQLLKPDGVFVHSNWQFLNSKKLTSRIQDWSKVGLSPDDVDPNDYLLDWRSGGSGLRYVHYYDENELKELAEGTGFKIKGIFYSDGETGNLGLYEIWQK